MTMPEASVYEDDCGSRSKHKVWLAGQPAIVEPKAKTTSVQTTTNDKLWSRVDSSNSGHHPAASGAIDDVRH